MPNDLFWVISVKCWSHFCRSSEQTPRDLFFPPYCPICKKKKKILHSDVNNPFSRLNILWLLQNYFVEYKLFHKSIYGSILT